MKLNIKAKKYIYKSIIQILNEKYNINVENIINKNNIEIIIPVIIWIIKIIPKKDPVLKK